MNLSLDLATLQEAYRQGALTPRAMVEEVLARIAAYDDPATWIHLLSRDRLRAIAEQVEARGMAAQPLYGVPFAIKDNLDLAHAPTTAACPEFSYTPTTSAPVVERLLAAGAIPIGKANLDQFATGLVGVRSPYGVPRNPFRADVIPGGSSSGSAVAVAAGLVSFALGTDTAGSGRVPAALNNLVGLKPTRGALSSRGLVPACRTLDCVSIFALCCGDAAVVWDIAAGYDEADPFSRVAAPVRAWPESLRVGVPPPAALSFFGDVESERLFRQSQERLTTLGHQLVEIDYTSFAETAALLYQGPWVAERWAALRPFHHQHADALFPVTRTILESAQAFGAADTFDGIYRLAELRRRAGAEWTKMDVLLLPTVPRPYTVAEVQAEPLLLNSRLGTYTNFVNLLDLCGLALPAGRRTDGIPHGITLLAPAWSEGALLRVGERWQATLGGTLGAGPHPVPRPRLAGPPAAGMIRLAVVGAHLTGLPLNHQLTERGARHVWSGRTAPRYRLYALPETQPAKPGLLRVGPGGAAIEVEVWELAPAEFGSFVAAIPPPLAIGSISLENGEMVKGFLCEPHALAGAEDITSTGGWRAYLAASAGSRS